MKIVIVGGGAGGLMTAGTALKFNPDCQVVILEKNEKTAKKLYITGKGRCNFTNVAEYQDFLEKIPRNSAFVRSCLSRFDSQRLIELIEGQGIPTKIERGNRAFPQSDKASDIIKALTRYSKGAELRLNTRVLSCKKGEDGFVVTTDKGEINCDRLVLATGGITYKATGSTGDGYALAKNFGHKITPLLGVLCGFQIDGVGELSGLTLKNVEATLVQGKGRSCFGDMLFTGDGISGPIILSLSSYYQPTEKGYFLIDLKPALDKEKLENRLVRELNENINKQIDSVMRSLLPRELIKLVLKQAKVPCDKKSNILTKEERMRIVDTLKSLRLDIKAKETDERSVITRGGVDVKEVNPKTMESKLVKGLYIIGELLDVNAETGGYNLQIAFSTAYVAGESITKED